MTKRELIRKELQALYKEGAELAVAFQKNEEKQFHYDYQRWYSKAIKAIASLAPDRHAEFRSYYEIDPKRKTLGYGTFVIQDFIKGVAPASHRIPDFDSRNQVLTCFFNQLTILQSVEDRIDSVISDIEGQLYAELQDSELVVARQLAKVSHRAAGALVGVVIEGHLQKVAANHGIKIAKKTDHRRLERPTEIGGRTRHPRLEKNLFPSGPSKPVFAQERFQANQGTGRRLNSRRRMASEKRFLTRRSTSLPSGRWTLRDKAAQRRLALH